MKQYRWILAFCVVLALLLLPLAASRAEASETVVAYEAEGGNLYFDTATGTITGCDDTVTVADIPETIEDAAVVKIGEGAFSNCYSLTSVTIPDSVREIDYEAFWYCYALETVTIGSGLESLPLDSFYSCESMIGIFVSEENTNYSSDENGVLFDKEKTELIKCPEAYEGAYDVPEGVIAIGDGAFSACYSLTEVTLPSTLEAIGNSAFSNCGNLMTVAFPDALTQLGDYAFYNCTELMKVTGGDGLESIGASAFEWCSKLTNVTIADTVQRIGEGAFTCCESLLSVTVPDSVTELEGSAFSGCTDLTQATLGAGVQVISDYLFSGCENLVTVHMPDDITAIGECAFSGCMSLTGFAIPETVESIGAGAFSDCDSIRAVTIPGSVSEICGETFYHCDNLRTVVIEEGVTLIGCAAFQDCVSLTELTIPESVLAIETDAFWFCCALKSVNIPDGVIRIEDRAFYDCNQMTSVTIGKNVSHIAQGAFSGCRSLEAFVVDEENEIYSSDAFGVLFDKDQIELIRCPESFSGDYAIPESVEIISDHAFSDCLKLTGIEIPEGVVFLGECAFYNCDVLKTVAIPDSVCDMGSRVFSECDKLATVTIGDGLYAVADGAFSSCPNLEDVTFGCNITEICDNAFDSCAQLGNITFPDVLERIGWSAFVGCESLTDVTFPESLSEIASYAFCDSGLTRVMIPESVEMIDEYAFSSCASLESVKIPGSALELGWNVFSYCGNLTNVTIADGFERIGGAMFSECTALANITIPASVMGIEESAFDMCESLNHIVYMGEEEAWTNLLMETGAYNDVLYNATVHCGAEGNEVYWKMIGFRETSDERRFLYCSNCEQILAESPETYICAHEETETVDQIEASCFDTGYSGDVWCTLCETMLEEGTVIPQVHSFIYTDNGDKHTVTCENCDYSAEEDHNYVDGACICGAVEVKEPQPDANLKFTMNISVGAAMSVSYNISASAVSEYADFYLEVSKANADGEPTVVTYGLSEGHEPMTNMMNIFYGATYEGISAKQMGDEFSTTLYAIDENGNLYYGETVTDSIKGYLVSKASKETATDEFKTMAVDMLKYGAEAQNIFNYGTDDLVTADLSEDLLSFATTEIPEATDISAVSGEGVTISANVTVGSKVELGLSIFKTGLSAPETVRCEIRDAEGNLIAEPTIANAMNMMFSAGYSEVGAREMRKPITATFYMGDEAISQTITWSVESYVAQVRANENSTENDIAMVNAMLTYGDSVGAYLTSIGQ